MSSVAARGADDKPRSVPTEIGKKARKAASVHTDSQRGHSHPNRSSLPLQLTTCGASAINGTVWDITIHGNRPRSTNRKRAITTAAAMPNTAPSASPNVASLNEYHAYPATELMQSYAAGWWRTLFKLRFPAAVPLMVPAFKLAATLSVVGVIVSEISTGVSGGIGRAVISYSQAATGDPTKVYAAVFGAAVMGLTLYGVVVVADIVLMRNRPQEAS